MNLPEDNRLYSSIVSTGRAVPSKLVSNDEVEARCGLESGWIEKRTGIQQRPVVEPEVAVSDLAEQAARKALQSWENEHKDRPDIGMLILATSTPDHLLPPTAPLVAHRLGLGTIPAFDIAVACSGFLYALQLADSHCKTTGQAILVVAANILSKRVSENDPGTAALFADGAGAAIVTPSPSPGVMEIALESDGSGYDSLKIPHGGSRHPFDQTTLAGEMHKMKVSNGMSVFRYAVESMSRLGKQVMDQAKVSSEEVDFWIPHQANLRIIESARERLRFSKERTGITIDRFANSSAATIPVALDHFRESGAVKTGNLILLTAAAAGLTSGAVLLRL